jgi:cytochrome c-type biogenesis protein
LAASVLIVSGLHFPGVFRIGFLYREARIETQSKPTTLIGASVTGLVFGLG